VQVTYNPGRAACLGAHEAACPDSRALLLATEELFSRAASNARQQEEHSIFRQQAARLVPALRPGALSRDSRTSALQAAQHSSAVSFLSGAAKSAAVQRRRVQTRVAEAYHSYKC